MNTEIAVFNFQLLKIPRPQEAGVRFKRKAALARYQEMHRPVEGRRTPPQSNILLLGQNKSRSHPRPKHSVGKCWVESNVTSL